ncbi:succinate dehydrogenase cytochrome b subunit [Sporocytophaga myxococcoides]|uniref:succinate dehydrogenase cytochrome b subunit n=1 Tax=Sporocytophaga myxococcoides TaxID=153721 RepID=UPI0003FED34E|nr:succinate dehydrogenase cytochrome b subunit [Sporocytophaga myxococcoides]
MGWLSKALSGNLGQKLIMSLTGLFLISFLLEHLLSNLLLLKSDGADFNAYAEFMKTNPVIQAAEYILFGGFIVHIIYAAIITAKNKKARPQGYAYNNASANSSWFSRNMGLSGSMVLIFLIVHLKSFFVPHKITHSATTTIYDDAIITFGNVPYTLFYVAAMVLLAFHLNHGFQSAFQTLGLRHPKYTPFIKKLGTAFAILVPAGFAAIPLYICFIR